MYFIKTRYFKFSFGKVGFFYLAPVNICFEIKNSMIQQQGLNLILCFQIENAYCENDPLR